MSTVSSYISGLMAQLTSQLLPASFHCALLKSALASPLPLCSPFSSPPLQQLHSCATLSHDVHVALDLLGWLFAAEHPVSLCYFPSPPPSNPLVTPRLTF